MFEGGLVIQSTVDRFAALTFRHEVRKLDLQVIELLLSGGEHVERQIRAQKRSDRGRLVGVPLAGNEKRCGVDLRSKLVVSVVQASEVRKTNRVGRYWQWRL